MNTGYFRWVAKFNFNGLKDKATFVQSFMSYHLKIYTSASGLPKNWDTVIGNHNIMLSAAYFHILGTSKPQNMTCYFMGFLKTVIWSAAHCFNIWILSGIKLFRKMKFGAASGILPPGSSAETS